MTMLQLNALSRGFNGLKWVIDAAPVTILLIFLQRCVYFVLIPPALQQLFNFTWTQTTGEFLFRPSLTVPGVCIFDTEEVTQRFPFHSHMQAANEQHTESRGCLSHGVWTRSCGSAAAPQAKTKVGALWFAKVTRRGELHFNTSPPQNQVIH